MNTTSLTKNNAPVISVVAMPADSNAAGDIFGGWIMSQVDIAGSVVATRQAKGRVVTVAVNSFEFHQPVFIGDLVSCYAEVSKIGKTSLTVNVKVYAERGRFEQLIKVTEAVLVYVAVDDNRKPRQVPKD